MIYEERDYRIKAGKLRQAGRRETVAGGKGVDRIPNGAVRKHSCNRLRKIVP